MHKNTSLLSIAAVVLLLTTAVPLTPATSAPSTPQPYFNASAAFIPDFPTAIAASDASPFYALIATPLAIHYNGKNQEIIPLYIKNFNSPSTAVQRAESMTGIYADYIVGGASPERASLAAAVLLWKHSDTAVLLSEDQTGYDLGVCITPLASYLSIPVIVAAQFDSDVVDVLDYLGIHNLYVCGNIACTETYNAIYFTSPAQILSETQAVIKTKFGSPSNYIVITNPLDAHQPAILNSTRYEFNGTATSSVVLPSQAWAVLRHGALATHDFTIPEGYKYAVLSFDLRNLDSQNVQLLGDRIMFMLTDSANQTYFYGSSAGGTPIRDPEGLIVEDRVHFETVMYNKPGTYHVKVYGSWFAQTSGKYNLRITVDSIDSPLVPLMSNISSTAAYLAAYHQGIVFANTSFAFAADDNVLYNGSPCPGVTQPGSNFYLGPASNEHTKAIHDQLNTLLASLAHIDTNDTKSLREHYYQDPAYIAIVADPTMVPMYFYHNPDGMADTHNGAIMGYYVPSDFYFGDIDPRPTDPENDTLTYWPVQENAVGRVTGIDAQDVSALLDRTFFYENIIANMSEWKNTSLVQTGCGLEFQNLPIATKLESILYSGRGEPTKFPTGESWFINTKLTELMATGGYDAKHTFWLQSQREGFTLTGLDRIKNTGLLSKLLFPKKLINLLSATEKVKGGSMQENSSLIFAFSHGFFNMYEFGDVFIDSRGFPGVTTWARIYPKARSSLSDKGAYDLRAVSGMKYGPAVIFVESCITARTDGMLAESVLSQEYLHVGVNAYIGSTRVTADPGYLEPRLFANGLGFGILGLLKAILQYKLRHRFPDLHFGAVIAEKTIQNLIDNDADIGRALRDSKNAYLPADANATFLWTPPLSLFTDCPALNAMLASSIAPQLQNERTRVLDKKYVALHEFALYGDPAFNPYQPCNEGSLDGAS